METLIHTVTELGHKYLFLYIIAMICLLGVVIAIGYGVYLVAWEIARAEKEVEGSNSMEEVINMTLDVKEEVVTMKLDTYANTLDELYRYKVERKEVLYAYDRLKDQTKAMKQFLLTVCLDTYKLKNYELERVTNYESWDFALEFKHILLQWFTVPEMVEFVEKEWRRLNA